MPSLIHLPSAVVRGQLTPAGQRVGADSGDPQLKTLPVRFTPTRPEGSS